MTLWSAAEESDWPSRWPKTASTGTQIAPPQASWRWTSLNCWETVNMRWGRQVSNPGNIWQLIGEGRIISLCLFASFGSNSAGQHVCVSRGRKGQLPGSSQWSRWQKEKKKKQVTVYIKISKPVISIQAHWLLFTLPLTLIPPKWRDLSVWFNNILVL